MKRSWLITIFVFLLILLLGTHASATVVCKLGDENVEVRKVQTRLYELGYQPAAPKKPYKFTSETQTYVKKFQLASGLPTKGSVDDVTYEALNSPDAVTYDAYQDTMMVNGGQGAEVKTVEARLKALGYMKGTADKYYDEKTMEAVSYFQMAHGMTETGKADTETRKRMNAKNAMTLTQYKTSINIIGLKSGAKGGQVKKLQTQLKELGYPVKITSTFDSKTVTAVKLFQAANGMSITGKAGEDTRILLNSGKVKTYAQYEEELAYMEVSKNGKHVAKSISVKLLQKRLTELAFYKGSINGSFSTTVLKSVRRFQDANNIDPKGTAKYGVATEATRKLMNSAKAVNRYDSEGYMYGDQGDAVLKITTRLRDLEYAKGTTNKYTTAVKKVVGNFQTANKLPKTGIADPVTTKVLFSDEAISVSEYKYGKANAKVKDLIDCAENYKGVPYKSPCNAPNSFDCSTFVAYCLKKSVGFSVTSEVQSQGKTLASKYGKITKLNDLQRGDLLYFDTQENKNPGHAAIYLGKDKKGVPWFIHASSAQKKVLVSEFDDWYIKRFDWGVRIFK